MPKRSLKGLDLDWSDTKHIILTHVTLSALTIFLPLVGAILGGIVGAWANSRYRDREEKKLRDQEIKGLTLLLFTEMGHNDATLETLKTFPDVADVPALFSLQTDVWEQCRVRVAQMVTNEHTATLVRYYEMIQDILRIMNDASMPNDDKTHWVLQVAEQAQKNGKAAMMHGGKYMFADYPEYTDAAHQQFVEVARKLMGRNPATPEDEN